MAWAAPAMAIPAFAFICLVPQQDIGSIGAK